MVLSMEQKMEIKTLGSIGLIKDMMEFASIGKDKAKYKYWKNFREKMETFFDGGFKNK